MKKNKKFILYILFGIITTILNIGLFGLLSLVIKNYKVANIITLIIVKIAAYICNKFFVFKKKNNNKNELFKEILRYIITRISTLLIDYFGLILLIDYINIPKLLGKIIIVINNIYNR